MFCRFQPATIPSSIIKHYRQFQTLTGRHAMHHQTIPWGYFFKPQFIFIAFFNFIQFTVAFICCKCLFQQCRISRPGINRQHAFQIHNMPETVCQIADAHRRIMTVERIYYRLIPGSPAICDYRFEKYRHRPLWSMVVNLTGQMTVLIRMSQQIFQVLFEQFFKLIVIQQQSQPDYTIQQITSLLIRPPCVDRFNRNAASIIFKIPETDIIYFPRPHHSIEWISLLGEISCQPAFLTQEKLFYESTRFNTSKRNLL